MTRLACALLLFSTQAFAGIYGHTSAEVGWTDDSRYLVYWGMGTTACDAQTGDCNDVDDAWLEAHPTTKVGSSRESLDGKAEATVNVVPVDNGTGSWKGNTWTPTSQASVKLGVVRDGKTTVTTTFVGSIHSLDVYWSPDKRRVGWVIRPSGWAGMDGGITVQIEIGSAGLPRIQLLADKGILKKALPVARQALDGAGFVVTGQGTAQKARTATVIYYAKGQDALAKAVAAAVPGGATVEKLTWKAYAEVVVALGASVLKGGK